MKREDKYKARAEFDGEDGERLVVEYDNRGDPYSEGATFEFVDQGVRVTVYLKKSELREIRRVIDTIVLDQ